MCVCVKITCSLTTSLTSPSPQQSFRSSHSLTHTHSLSLTHTAMRDTFAMEAMKFNVYPIDNSRTARLDVSTRPSLMAGRNETTFYKGMIRIPEGMFVCMYVCVWCVCMLSTFCRSLVLISEYIYTHTHTHIHTQAPAPTPRTGTLASPLRLTFPLIQRTACLPPLVGASVAGPST